MKLSKKLITATVVLAITAVASITPLATTHAANSICNQSGVSEEIKKANGCGGESSAELSDVIVNIINGFVGIFGLVAVIFIVVGGVNYMTSTGDAGKIEKAKKTILYAVIGLIISVLAFAIVNFVIKNVISSGSGSESTQETNVVNGGGPVV